MDLNLSGKHALVCGASQGIGRATALELARLGASVTALARSREPLEALLAELPKSGAQTHAFIAVDMNDHAALRAKIEAATQVKPVQILVNNTGGPPAGPAHTAAPEDFRSAFSQHLIAAQIALQAVLPGMRGSGYGRIVNVISTSVKEPLANLGVSNTVRAAMATTSAPSPPTTSRTTRRGRCPISRSTSTRAGAAIARRRRSPSRSATS